MEYSTCQVIYTIVIYYNNSYIVIYTIVGQL
jgi:hypothetical protein